MEGKAAASPRLSPARAGPGGVPPPTAPRAGSQAFVERYGASPQFDSLTLPHVPALSPGTRNLLRRTAAQK